MNTPTLFLLATASLLSGTHAIRFQDTPTPVVGQLVPDLGVEDTQGNPVHLRSEGSRASVLLFYSSRTRFGDPAIADLAKALHGAPEIAVRSTVYLVLDTAEDEDKVRGAFATDRVTLRVIAAPDHGPHGAFHVIAYPSAFILDGHGRLVEAVKGYGTLFAHRVLSATRLALGDVDREAYEKLLHGESQASNQKTKRRLQLARRLVAERGAEAGLSVLLPDSDPTTAPRGLAIYICHLLILSGKTEQAGPWLDRVVGDAPLDPSARLLSARAAIASGDLEGARAVLDEMDHDFPEGLHTWGLLLEAEGKNEEAREAFRRAAEPLLFFPD